jgi:dihydrofolate reductase
MGRIAVTEFISLDGVNEDPGGGSYKHAGWTFEIGSVTGQQFKLREAKESSALLLGRVTYEGFAAHWPNQKDEFGDKLNSMPKYVVSSTLANPTWNNSTVLSGDLGHEVRALRASIDGEILVYGSATLVQGLLGLDLVDDLRLMVFPVILGSGRRLFGELEDKLSLTHAGTTDVGNGVHLLTYRRA